jgi:hypothetical protein
MSEPGPWQLYDDETERGRRYWMIGRPERGAIRFQVVTYSKQPKRWYSEEAARTALSMLARQLLRVKREAAAREAIPPWPFPMRGRTIEEITP